MANPTPHEMATALAEHFRAKLALCNAATKGPWTERDDPYQPSDYNQTRRVVLAVENALVAYTDPLHRGKPDARFIADSRNSRPTELASLLAIVEDCAGKLLSEATRFSLSEAEFAEESTPEEVRIAHDHDAAAATLAWLYADHIEVKE